MRSCFAPAPASHARIILLLSFFFSLLLCISFTRADEPESTNTTNASGKEGSFAELIDRALEKEFTETEQTGGEADAGSFNNSVAEKQAVLETVARVTPKKNDSKEDRSFQFHHVFNLDSDNQAEDIPTLIDRKDNVFIISNPKSKYPVLQLDLRLISDLVVVIVSATCGGIAFACAGQPVITGYLLAGSIIGPGGFSFVSELVQVETVAQFGVIFLLFALGLEFSMAKLRVVRAVAVLGGLLQIFLFICLCGLAASLCGGKSTEGAFVGALLSMSSTAVVLKFLMERSSINLLHGQVTVGTLILQDCAVGLLFALLPVLGGTSGILQGVMSMAKSLIMLCIFLAVLSLLSRTCVPWFLKLMISLSSQTNELYQLASVAFCLLVAWVCDQTIILACQCYFIFFDVILIHLVEWSVPKNRHYLFNAYFNLFFLIFNFFRLAWILPINVYLGILFVSVEQHVRSQFELSTLSSSQRFENIFSNLFSIF